MNNGRDRDEEDDEKSKNSIKPRLRSSRKGKGLPNPEYNYSSYDDDDEEEREITTEDDSDPDTIEEMQTHQGKFRRHLTKRLDDSKQSQSSEPGNHAKKVKLGNRGVGVGRRRLELTPQDLTCKQCGKMFKKRKNLQIHLKRIHAIRDPFRCDLCPALLKTEGNLRQHTKSHLKVKVKREKQTLCAVICDSCGKVCKNKYLLKSHVTFVHGDLEFIACDLCPKKYKSQSALGYHKKTAHEKTAEDVLCTHCGKTLRNMYSLQLHIQRLHGAKLQCQFCGKEFGRKELLKKHEDAHRNGKKFSMPLSADVKVRFIKGLINGKLLVCEGYVFGRTNTYNKATFFKCTHYKKEGCKAMIVVHDFDQEKDTYSWMEWKEMDHNHPMHPGEVKRWEARTRVKELIASNPEAMTGELVKKIKEEFGMDAEEARTALGKRGTFKRFINRARNKDIKGGIVRSKDDEDQDESASVTMANGSESLVCS